MKWHLLTNKPSELLRRNGGNFSSTLGWSEMEDAFKEIVEAMAAAEDDWRAPVPVPLSDLKCLFNSAESDRERALVDYFTRTREGKAFIGLEALLKIHKAYWLDEER